MDIDKYKHQHTVIFDNIRKLKEFSHLGIAEHAADIAAQVIKMSSVIKLHLSIEDKFLYPALQEANNPRLATMGKQYQHEMTHIAEAYGEFARKWNDAGHVAADPDGFRNAANKVLKVLFDRMQREDRDFYPMIENA
ncbi:hemerythrin [Herbaspirillum hiltneri N3]|uniref:Hemerythrin n=1 Tax=Herbaspirillum hiltneri N3 TaxID=1262470 RepID=A0ABM5V1K4_9BURK|nr:hemerythrin domain-containing protein [Herbaspirillum hiltneri]AKZ63404.1 hemerythrin [Herbaspirillum hiltneri N3]